MFQEFRPLPMSTTFGVNYLLRPEQLNEPLGLYSPAVKVMTDFLEVTPVCIEQDVQVDEALAYMKSQHVRLLFAVDRNERPIGIITAADLLGSALMSFMQRSGQARDAVTVKDLMRPTAEAAALRYSQVEAARIGDVMQTLSHSGGQHVLVIDKGIAGIERIRGIISASNVSRVLKVGFDVMYEAKSFAEIERMVTHGNQS